MMCVKKKLCRPFERHIKMESKTMSDRCMFCSNEKPVCFCKNCDCMLGKNCLTNHKKLPVFGDHVTVELDEKQKLYLDDASDECESNIFVVNSTGSLQKCQDIHLRKCSYHDTENQSLYCVTHDVTMCGRCLRSKHKSCIGDCVDLFEVTVDGTRLSETLSTLGNLEKEIEEYENTLKENIKLNNDCKSKTLEFVNTFCSKLIRRLTELKENVERECSEKHKQNSERLDHVVEKCEEEKLIVNRRKLLIEELVQQKHDRHLYVEIVRLKRDQKEISARVKRLSQDNEIVHFFFRQNEELEKVLFGEIIDIGKIQETVNLSDEITEDAMLICIGREEENLKFYRNEIPSKPGPGYYIEEILQWKGDYQKLESGRSYFQWLFPIPEPPGLHEVRQELSAYEAQDIRNDAVMRDRVLRAYKMMLDFYGMELVDEKSGQIRRCEANWNERYAHLNKSKHNHARITRLLKSLGELGYEKLQWPLVSFIMVEAVVNKELPYLNSDIMNHWIAATKDQSEGLWMYKLWQNMRDHPERFDQRGNPRTNTL